MVSIAQKRCHIFNKRKGVMARCLNTYIDTVEGDKQLINDDHVQYTKKQQRR